MNHHPRISSDLITRIHHAALHPERFADVMTTLARDLSADGAQALAFVGTDEVPSLRIVGGVETAACTEAVRQFRVDTGRAIGPEISLKINDSAGGRAIILEAMLDDEHTMLFAAARKSGREPFSAGSQALLAAYLPELQHSFRVRLRLERLRTRSHALEALLDGCSVGVILLNGHGHRKYANAAAEGYLNRADGLRCTGQGLVASTPSLTRRLLEMIERAQSRTSGINCPFESLLLNDSTRHGPQFEVLAVPVRCSPFDALIDNVQVAVYVRDISATSGVDHKLLITRYGLTRAEAQCAERLGAGESVAAIAAVMGLSPHTVRSHLRSIFGKTGVRRQGELIALLARGRMTLQAFLHLTPDRPSGTPATLPALRPASAGSPVSSPNGGCEWRA